MTCVNMKSFINEVSHIIYNDPQECLISLATFMYSNLDNPVLCKDAMHWVFKRIERDCDWRPENAGIERQCSNK